MKKRIISILLVSLLMVFLLPAYAASPSAQVAGEKMNTLGIMRGTDKGLELDKPLTRQEAVVLVVRLLGQEKAAIAGDFYHPFSDVSPWANCYVGFAYKNSIIQGFTPGKLSSGDSISAAEFLTMILRALKYAPLTGYDQSYAYEMSDQLGLTHGEYSAASKFLRGDAAAVSLTALGICDQKWNKRLLDMIYEEGAVPAKAIEKVGLSDILGKGFARLPLNSVTGSHTPSQFYGLTNEVFAMEYLDNAESENQSAAGVILFSPSGNIIKEISLPKGYRVDSNLQNGKLICTLSSSLEIKTMVIDASGTLTEVTAQNGTEFGLASPDGSKTAFTLNGDLYLAEGAETTVLLPKSVDSFGDPIPQYAFCWIDNSRLVFYTGTKNDYAGGGIVDISTGVCHPFSPNYMKPLSYKDGKLCLIGSVDDVVYVDVDDPTYFENKYITIENSTGAWGYDSYGVSRDSSSILYTGRGVTNDGYRNKLRVYSFQSGEMLIEKVLSSNSLYQVISFSGSTAALYLSETNELLLVDMTAN